MAWDDWCLLWCTMDSNKLDFMIVLEINVNINIICWKTICNKIFNDVYTEFFFTKVNVEWAQAAPKQPTWASYQICKIAGCACAGNAGNISLSPRVSDPGIHHGTCVAAIWEEANWRTCRDACRDIANYRLPFKSVVGKTLPGICAIRNFTYLVRGPRQTIRGAVEILFLDGSFQRACRFILSFPFCYHHAMSLQFPYPQITWPFSMG